MEAAQPGGPPPRRPAAIEALERLGGHGAYLANKDDGSYIAVTRPGKTAGTSASIGHLGPGIAKVFTDSWAPLRQGHVYDADELALVADAIDLDQEVPDVGRRPGARLVDPPEAPRIEFVRGGAFILDEPEGVPAVWGHHDEVLWPEGEPLLIAAPIGVGKATLAGQLVKGTLGLRDKLLGYPIAEKQRALYIAADRPRQIARSQQRQFTSGHRQTLDERLVVWKGPPPADLAEHPDLLGEMCSDARADAVFIDSLKDVALGLTEDDVGAGLNQAIQRVIGAGIDVCCLHHQRKGRADGKKPKGIEDVYGSVWIAAGAGSVILLWGAPGDLVVELLHLKQPAAAVGPLKIEHDPYTGTSVIHTGYDVAGMVTRAGQNGITPVQVAREIYSTNQPTDAQRASARRKLDHLARVGKAKKVEAAIGGSAGGQSGTRYVTLLKLVEPPSDGPNPSDEPSDAGTFSTPSDAGGKRATADRKTAGQPSDEPSDASDAETERRDPVPLYIEGPGALGGRSKPVDDHAVPPRPPRRLPRAGMRMRMRAPPPRSGGHRMTFQELAATEWGVRLAIADHLDTVAAAIAEGVRQAMADHLLAYGDGQPWRCGRPRTDRRPCRHRVTRPGLACRWHT